MDERAAQHRDDSRLKISDGRLFPVPLLEKDSLDFSFSGLKSAALREIQERKTQNRLTDDAIDEICYEYLESVTQTLVEKLMRATQEHGISQIYIVGGVSANTRLTSLLEDTLQGTNIAYSKPASLRYCGDNAAMIGITAYYKYLHNQD